MKKIFILFILFSLFSSSVLLALEIKEGFLKLVLHKGIGCFSLYYLDDLNKMTYMPLFLDKDPRTSFLSIVSKNKIYKIGEASEFKEEIKKTNTGACFIWTSKTLKIIEDFEFICQENMTVASEIIITITIENISDHTIDVGCRMLFDTYLGEKINLHFKTNMSLKINHENIYHKINMVDYWISPKSKELDSHDFKVITKGYNVTTPDSIIFANWKRLNDASWSYKTSESRNFNMLPYSVNDSAVCHYYEPESIKSKSSKKIVLRMGKTNTRGTTMIKDKDTRHEKITEIFDEIDPSLDIKSDLKIIEDLMLEIDKRLESMEISEEDIKTIRQIIDKIKNKYPQE